MQIKGFAFVNKAAEREYKDLPVTIQKDFGVSLDAIQNNRKPFLDITPLSSIGAGVIELKIQGSPAYRCVYIAKYANIVFVLHSFAKTTNGVDRQGMNTAKLRYKELIEKMRAISKNKES